MPSENDAAHDAAHSVSSGLPRAKHLTIRLPIDLLTEVQRQASQAHQGRSANVNDWIVGLIEQTLRPQPQESSGIVTSTDAAFLRENPSANFTVSDYGNNYSPDYSPDDPSVDGRAFDQQPLMITAGEDLSLTNASLTNSNLTDGNLTDGNLTDLGLGEPVGMEEVQAYVSGYVEDYVTEYFNKYTDQSDHQTSHHQIELDHRLEQFDQQLHQQQQSFLTLQESLQNQVNTLQNQLNYCLGEYSA